MWIELDGEEMSVEEVIEETGGSDDDDDAVDPIERLLAFITDPNASNAGYEFTAAGPVEFTDAPYESPSGGSIEGGTYTSEDFIDDDSDPVHAGGITGGGHGDSFTVTGPIHSLDLEQPDVMWVELDGEELTPDEIIDETGGDGGENEPEDGDEDEDEPDEDDSDDEPRCGTETDGAAAEGELEGNWWGDSDDYTYALRTANPCGVTITLESSGDAAVTLYVNTDGSVPDRWSYEESLSADGELTLDLEGDEHLGLRVHASSGSATYASKSKNAVGNRTRALASPIYDRESTREAAIAALADEKTLLSRECPPDYAASDAAVTWDPRRAWSEVYGVWRLGYACRVRFDPNGTRSRS